MRYNLSELCDIIGGGTPKTNIPQYWGGNIPWLSVKDFNNDRKYVYEAEKAITEEGLNNSAATTLIKGDIIISARGTVGEMAVIPYPMSFNQSCYGLRAKKEIVDADYLYYLVKFKVKELKHNAHGSVFDTITRDTFEGIEVDIPSKVNQQKIASILAALDSKIETNETINHNLYHLLMLSFQHEYWEKSTVCGWPMTTLGEVTSKFGTGLNPRKNFVLGQGSNYYVTIKNMGANRIFLDNRCDKIDDDAIEKIQKRSNLQVGDLLFSGIGTIGRVYLIDKPISNWNTSESIFNLHPIQNISSEFLYLLLLNDDMQKYAVSLASGSVQKGIRMADLKRYKFPLPPNDVMNQLTNLWAPIIQKIKTYEDENDHLASLRDTLLPKLMSGEIDVSQVEI